MGIFDQSIKMTMSGVLYVGTESEGVYRFDGETWTIFEDSDGFFNNAGSIIIAPDGDVWYGTYGGVFPV